MTASVAKVNKYVVTGPGAGISSAKVIKYVVTGPTTITVDLLSSYGIEAAGALSVDLASSFAVSLGASIASAYSTQLGVSLVSDYDLNFIIDKTINFDYRTQLGVSLVANYSVNNTIVVDLTSSFAVSLGSGLSSSYAVELGRDLVSSYNIAIFADIAVDLVSDFGVNPLGSIFIDFVSSYAVTSQTLTENVFMLLPETPVSERWVFDTAVTVARDGSEQRAALRENPRVGIEYDFVILDDNEYRTMMELIFSRAKPGFILPMYAHAANTLSNVAAGGTTLFYTTALTDIRLGDYVFYMTPQGDQGAAGIAVFVGAGSLILAEPLPFDLPAGSWIMPALDTLLDDGNGLSMSAVAGSAALSFVARDNARPVRRPGQASGLVPTFDSLPLLDQRHSADTPIPDLFIASPEIIDEASDAPTVSLPTMVTPRVGGVRQYRFDRRTGLDYWREFAYLTQGQRAPFLINSYRKDLTPLTGYPAGATLHVAGKDYRTKFANDEYRRVQIETTAGTSNHVVTAVAADGANTNLTLATPYVGDDILRVSYLRKVRLTTDTITFSHAQLHSVISFSVRGVTE